MAYNEDENSIYLEHPRGYIQVRRNQDRIFGREDFNFLTSDESSYISRKAKGGHFAINSTMDSYGNVQFFIQDLGSANGTLVNGREIRGMVKQTLRDGDFITLGDRINFRFKTESRFAETRVSPRAIPQNELIRPVSKNIELGYNQKYCSYCGAVIHNKAETCLNCGVRQNSVDSPQIKNSGLAAVLSFFIPGLGQIYNGEIAKGLVIMFILLPIAVALTIVVIGFILLPVVYIYSIYDSYNTAEKINKKLN